MALYALLAIPTTLMLLFGVLLLSAFVEERVLSPRAVVLSVARARGSSPEYAEALVARECERVLADSA